MYSTFASIGLKSLVPSLGTRENTVEYIPVKRLDESATGCFMCPHYKKNDNACLSCEKQVFYNESQKVYVNEKNRYGLKKTLKKNALLLYIALHFLNPDDNGYIACADSSELADTLGCTVRTVENNLVLLSDAGYISAGSHSIDLCHQVFINGYRDSFKKASEGGRGFIRVSLEFFNTLVSLPDINALRLALRTYIESAEGGNRVSEKSLKSIKSLLPSYVTKKDLISVITGEVFSKLFTVKTKVKSAVIKIKESFDQSHVLDLVRGKCREEVVSLKDRINTDIRKKRTSAPLFNLSERELTDIANISLRFPISVVLEAAETFYNTYVKRNIVYGSAGALIRSFAEDIVIIS